MSAFRKSNSTKVSFQELHIWLPLHSVVINSECLCQYCLNYNYNYNHFTALWILSGTTRVSRHQKGKTKTNLDFLEQETVSAYGISWAICKSAPRSRQITMPSPHHLFLQARCPSYRPANNVKALKCHLNTKQAYQWTLLVSQKCMFSDSTSLVSHHC